jgi:hypothetical protein
MTVMVMYSFWATGVLKARLEAKTVPTNAKTAKL